MLHLRSLEIPPSSFWSAEFSKYFAEWPNDITKLARLRVPARGAPKVEWDKFHLLTDQHFAGALAKAVRLYQVRVVDTYIKGVHVGIISPRAGIPPQNQHRVLINLHGGGFVFYPGLVFGQLESIPVAALGGIKVITIDYRQAPFFSYPAATEDVEAVYRELLKQYEPEAIGIFGCSAGASLTAQSVAWFQAKKLPRPGAVGLFCSGPDPRWIAREGDSAMWLNVPEIEAEPENEAQPQQADSALSPVEWYMEGVDRDDPKAYPGASDEVLAKFPPTLFLNGTRDFTMSAAIAAHARMLKLGVDSELYIVEGAPHAAHATAVGTPEAQDANSYVARWFDRHLARHRELSSARESAQALR